MTIAQMKKTLTALREYRKNKCIGTAITVHALFQNATANDMNFLRSQGYSIEVDYFIKTAFKMG